jgi:hypothetical protein
MFNPFDAMLDNVRIALLNKATRESRNDEEYRTKALRYLFALYLPIVALSALGVYRVTTFALEVAQAVKEESEPIIIHREGSLVDPEEFDLQLMPAAEDANRFPTEGKSRIVVGEVNHGLHFRQFDGHGTMVMDTDEELLKQGNPQVGRQIEELKTELASLRAHRELTGAEKGKVITAVTALVGHGSEEPRPSETPDQLKVRSQQEALTEVSRSAGVPESFVLQSFRPAADVVKLASMEDLREQYVLDVAGERYLIKLLELLTIRSKIVDEIHSKQSQLVVEIEGLDELIVEDVRRGGIFADPKLQLRERRLAAIAANKEVVVPRVDTGPIYRAVIEHKPIRRLDIVELIVLLRAMNQAIQDLDTSNKASREFVFLVPDGYFNDQRGGSAEPDGPIEDSNDAMKALQRSVAKHYSVPQAPPLALNNEYRTRGIVDSVFAKYGLGAQKAMAEHEAAAQVLERFLGVRKDSPPETLEPDGRKLDPEAAAAQLPLRAPAPGLSASSEKFQEAQNRLRVLEAQRWIPAVQDASAKVLGSDRAFLRLEGLAGTWVFSEGKLYFGEGAAPLRIVDRELLRSLAPPPIESDPDEYIGIERRVFTFPDVLAGRWILVLQDTKAAGRIDVRGLERLEREWPSDSGRAKDIIESAGFVFLGPGPATVGNYMRETRQGILSNLKDLDSKCFEEMRFQWQRWWGQAFTLPGFDGQWRFSDRGTLVRPDPIVITDSRIVSAVFLSTREDRAQIPGMSGTWDVSKDRLVLRR